MLAPGLIYTKVFSDLNLERQHRRVFSIFANIVDSSTRISEYGYRDVRGSFRYD